VTSRLRPNAIDKEQESTPKEWLKVETEGKMRNRRTVYCFAASAQQNDNSDQRERDGSKSNVV
jgi:hypothetical protein